MPNHGFARIFTDCHSCEQVSASVKICDDPWSMQFAQP